MIRDSAGASANVRGPGSGAVLLPAPPSITRPTPAWPHSKVHDTGGSGIFVYDGGPGKLAKNVVRARNTE